MTSHDSYLTQWESRRSKFCQDIPLRVEGGEVRSEGTDNSGHEEMRFGENDYEDEDDDDDDGKFSSALFKSFSMSV